MIEDGDLVVVLDAPDWGSAYAVKSLLESGGVPVVLLDERSNWEGASAYSHLEYYARIAVPRGHADSARELIEAYQVSADHSAEQEPKERWDSRQTAAGWKGSCIFMAAACGASVWLAAKTEYDWWFSLLALWMLWMGSVFSYGLRKAPPRFHPTIRVAAAACYPAGIGLMLAAGDYIGWMTWPHVITGTLCAASAVAFAYGAAIPIPTSEQRAEDRRLD